MTSLSETWTPATGPPLLEGNDVHVWRVALEVPTAERGSLRRVLSAEERARAERFATDKLRHRFVVGRGVTRLLLGAYSGEDPSNLEFRLGENDKPYLTGEPALSSLQFNVSHSADLALIAVTRGREVGVDLEWVRSNLDQVEIASRFFSANETAKLRSLSGNERVRHFIELWTCKEAFVKAQGGGISFGLNRFEVMFEPNVSAASITNEDDSLSSWVIHRFEPARGCLGAVALEGPDLELALLDWSPPS